MSDLAIIDVNRYFAPCTGGTTMILLCEKVAEEDIQVRFFEVKNEKMVWEGFGDINLVHKQYAIVFQTPSYHTMVDEPVNIFIQLRRPSDGATGEPVPFQMLPPIGTGRPAFWSLRKAFARKKTDYSTFGKIIATESALLSNVR